MQTEKQYQLPKGKMMTFMQVLNQLNCDIMRKSKRKIDFNEPVSVCEKCGYPLQKDIRILNELRRVPVNCKCKEDDYNTNKEIDERKNLERRLNKFRAYSLMDKNFENSTFENWQFKGDNRKMYEFGVRYCRNWQTMKDNNRGVIIQGTAGNGKTYLSFAIANELNKQGISVLAVSAGKILTLIQDSYRNSDSIGEIQILNTLNEVSLLILDDLGTESRTKWAYEKLYAVIDGRYRIKKPLIITTNLSEKEFRENLKTVDFKTGLIDPEERIYNRLVEVCTTLRINSSSWRILKGKENTKALYKELGLEVQGS